MNILEQSIVMEGMDGKPDHQILLSIGQSFSPQSYSGSKNMGSRQGPIVSPTFTLIKKHFP